MCLRFGKNKQENEIADTLSYPKGFKKIDDILDSSFSGKLGDFYLINNQIELCSHTIEEVKSAVDNVLKFGEDYVGYKNNGICRHLVYYLKDGGNIEDLNEFIKYKFNTIDIIEIFLKKSFGGEGIIDLFIENFKKNINFSVKVEFLDSEKENYIECNFFGSDNLVNHYYTLLGFHNKLNNLKYKGGLRIDFIEQSESLY